MQSYFGHIYIPKCQKIKLESESVDNFAEEEYELIEGVRLFMEGDEFWIEAAIEMYGVEQYNLIKGAFTGLGYVTLLECNVIGLGNGVGGNETKISCKYVLTGIQIDNEEHLNFTQLSVTMPSLRGWFDKTIFKQVNIFDDTISLVKHDSIPLASFDNFSLEAFFSISQSLNRESGLKVNDAVTLKIKATKDRLSLWEFIDIYKKFKKFLAFIGIFDKDCDYFIFLDEEVKYEKRDDLVPMKFFREQYNFKNNGVDAIKKVKYDFIEKDIETVLTKWYNLNDLSDSIDLVLEKYLQAKLSLESFFLNSCFAIEIYHRRFKKNERYPKAEFRRIKKEILSNIKDEEANKFFEEKLAHANEPSFRERLESLNEDFQMVLPLTMDTNSLIKGIVNTRNHIVHRSSSKGIISGLELYYASFYLEALTKLCVFKELGFSQWHILTIFSNSRDQIESMYHFNKRLQTGIKKEKA
ncbi:hypothetical protein FEDK69T_31490 [Flavobacterium enshiense DK69]|uniref:Uncharacterized protein n=1 Tax=Flavobacterium enshiense DK69 TaxID=1107311 RepID=V6RYF0_9FLAO|nr:HEPN domain-containing protein [Flavobacterium enshiense]ESU19478.1 hypothetical protein FEDK69T_31490 [Flavobacterium enshiense DK69]KGO92818.1 hypothetical protein Q767_15355 [Flavobacterium enshiense DK69]